MTRKLILKSKLFSKFSNLFYLHFNSYWERRRRNNESAKRSREIRKRKEMQTSTRIQYLEQENVKLQTEVNFLREEIERLRQAERLPYLLHQKVVNPSV